MFKEIHMSKKSNVKGEAGVEHGTFGTLVSLSEGIG